MRLIEPSTLPELHDRIRYLLTLEEDWDSYGAYPIDANAGSLIMQIVDTLATEGHDDLVAMAEIFPVPDGGMQIEFDGAVTEIEVEVMTDLSYDMIFCPVGPDHDQWRDVKLPAGTPVATVVQMIREAEPATGEPEP